MVDFGTFVESLPWLSLLEVDDDQKVNSKRVRRETIKVFTGKSCFIIDSSIIAIAFGEDHFALETTVSIDDGQLVIEWTSPSKRMMLCLINHSLVRFLRRSRPNRMKPSPPWLSLDFGDIQLRLWRQDSSYFVLPLLVTLHEQLRPSESTYDVKTVIETDEERWAVVIRDAMNQIESSLLNSNRRGLYEGLDDIIKISTAIRS